MNRRNTVVDRIVANPERTKQIIILLLTLWPLVLGVLGLPTGAAETAVNVYRGVEACPPCPEATVPTASSEVSGD